MAYSSLGLAQVSASMGKGTPSNIFVYNSSADTLATCIASDYFATAEIIMQVGDIIFVTGSDDQSIVRVTAVDPITVASFIDASVIPDGSITNAKVNASAAIDYSKLATLTDGNLLVGNGSNVATSVAMSGDVTIANTGATTIGAGAIDLAMLSSGITPSAIVVYDGKESNGGGSATVAITVTGVAATDRVFAQLEASTNAVTVQKVTPTADTITVTLSGDPGASTIIAYQAIRTAA